LQIPKKVDVLRLYIGESHFVSAGMPVYEDLLYRAREQGLAGATIIKSGLGFGQAELKPSSSGHKYRISDDAPVIIEIVDDAQKIDSFIPIAQKLMSKHGLMTRHSAEVVHYGEINY
jgi:PII-like signaling protein